MPFEIPPRILQKLRPSSSNFAKSKAFPSGEKTPPLLKQPLASSLIITPTSNDIIKKDQAKRKTPSILAHNQQQNCRDSSNPREGSLRSTKLLVGSVSEEKGEARIQKSPGPAILPHPLSKKISSLLTPYPKHFSRKKKSSLKSRILDDSPNLLEESCIRALVPSLSTKSAPQSSHSHHFKHLVFHIPHHKSKFLPGSRHSSSLRQQKKKRL